MSGETYLAYDYPLLSAFWTMLIFFLWIMWFVLLFRIVVDIFRDDDMSGWAKPAGWCSAWCCPSWACSSTSSPVARTWAGARWHSAFAAAGVRPVHPGDRQEPGRRHQQRRRAAQAVGDEEPGRHLGGGVPPGEGHGPQRLGPLGPSGPRRFRNRPLSTPNDTESRQRMTHATQKAPSAKRQWAEGLMVFAAVTS